MLTKWSRGVWSLADPLARKKFLIVPLDTLPPKTGGSRWNFVAVMSTSRDIRISRLEAAILDFWLPVTSDIIPNSTVGLLASLSRNWDLPSNHPLCTSLFSIESRGSKIFLKFVHQKMLEWVVQRCSDEYLKNLRGKIWRLKNTPGMKKYTHSDGTEQWCQGDFFIYYIYIFFVGYSPLTKLLTLFKLNHKYMNIFALTSTIYILYFRERGLGSSGRYNKAWFYWAHIGRKVMQLLQSKM